MKYILSLLVCFSSFVSFAQNQFPFIPNNQYQLTEKQLESTAINITPDVLLFNEQGKLLSMSSMGLMTNPEYKPVFFADASGKIKSLVFTKRSNNPVIIEPKKQNHFTPGEHAIDFLATDLEGNTFKLSDLRGKVVVLNFWFTKCGPCISEIPQLNQLVYNFKDKDVIFLAITFNDKEIIYPFLNQHPFQYTIIPNANDIVNMYRVNSFPSSMVINKNGEVVLKDSGYRTNIKEYLATAINASL